MNLRTIGVILFGLVSMLSLQAAPVLSGSYRGDVTFTPKDGATRYDDRTATLVILPDTGKGAVAVITYSDQLGRYRERCSITPTADGTITLKGVSYALLAGDSFNLDTFHVQVGADGSVTGNSVDTDGGTSVLSFHH
jgi:hypothetical protein